MWKAKGMNGSCGEVTMWQLMIGKGMKQHVRSDNEGRGKRTMMKDERKE